MEIQTAGVSPQSGELEELLFELGQGGYPKICLAVCDSEELKASLNEELRQKLSEMAVSTANWTVTKQWSNFVDSLFDVLSRTRTDVLVIDGFDKLDQRKCDRLFGDINFKRDRLFSQNFNSLYWLTSVTLGRLIERAPDFWSRRTSTHFFTPVTIQSRLTAEHRQLTENETRPPNVPPQPSTTRKDYGSLLRSLAEREDQLEFHKSQKFLLDEEVDELIQSMRRTVNGLIEDCHRKERFTIAFELWRMARLEDQISHYFKSFKDEKAKSYFHDFDATEILIGMVARLPQILTQYNFDLRSSFSNPGMVNLLDRFQAEAHESAYRRVKLLSLKERMRAKGLDPKNERDWNLHLDQNLSSYDTIVQWLEDGTVELPPTFTPLEGRMLRTLYNDRDKPHAKRAIATLQRMSSKEVEKEINLLRKKLIAYLRTDKG